MRVVQVIPWFSPFGGGERVGAELAIQMAELGHQSHIVSLYDPREGNGLYDEVSRHAVKAHALAKKPGPRIQTALRLRRLLNDLNPDVVHSHLSGLRYSMPLRDRTSYLHIHTIHTDPRFEAARAATAIHRHAYRTGVAPVVLSRAFTDSFSSMYGSNPRLRIVANGVREPPHSLRSESTSATLRVTCISRLERHKRVDIALQALSIALEKSRQSVELRIVGTGSQEKVLKSLALDLGVGQSVRFEGQVDSSWPILAQSDLLLLTSDYEGMPLVTIEAAMMGVPSVATDVGAVAEIVIDGETGLIVPRRDPSALANALVRLARDRTALKQMGRNALSHSSGYTVSEMADSYQAVYSEFLEARRR